MSVRPGLASRPALATGFDPFWPGLSLSVAAAALALLAEESWMAVLAQSSWNLLSASDFGALAIGTYLLAWWRGLSGSSPPSGFLAWREPGQAVSIESWPMWRPVAALLPFGFGIFLLAQIIGVRLSYAWAAAWLPMLLLFLGGLFSLAGLLGQWRQTARQRPRGLILAMLIPLALLAALGLVLAGLARPVEALAVALVGVGIGSVVLQGTPATWQMLQAANGLGLNWLGGMTLWLLAGTWLFVAAGLCGLQASVGQLAAALAWTAPASAGLGLLLVMILALWLPPAVMLLFTTPVLVPWLTAAGYAADWCVVFLALCAGLGAVLRRASSSSRWLPAVEVFLPLLLLLALIAWPDAFLAPARALRFW